MYTSKAILRFYTFGIVVLMTVHAASAVKSKEKVERSDHAISKTEQRQTEAIQIAAFQELVRDARWIHLQDWKLRFSATVPLKSLPLRRVNTLNLEHDLKQQYDECYVAKTQELTLSPRVLQTIHAYATAVTRTQTGQGQLHKQGVFWFRIGQIRWDGKDSAIVQTRSGTTPFPNRPPFPNGEGGETGRSYRLRREGKSWHVVTKKVNFEAGT